MESHAVPGSPAFINDRTTSSQITDRMQDQATQHFHRGTERLIDENLAFRTFIVYLDIVLA
jgi:hypothetical protein